MTRRLALGARDVRGQTDPLVAARKRRLTDRSELKRELKRLGIRRSHGADAPVWVLAMLLAVAAAVAAVGAATHTLSAQSAVALSAVVISVAGLLVALLQWRNGLAEKAFDALYQRIALANQMRLQAFQGLDTDDESLVATKRREPYKFFVYSEIDSLEYAARRYRFGLGLNHEICNRALRHFRSRCASETFRRFAEACAEDGAYFDDTKALVKTLTEPAVTKEPTKQRVPEGRSVIEPDDLALDGLVPERDLL